jgi:HlyD family secretion protein
MKKVIIIIVILVAVSAGVLAIVRPFHKKPAGIALETKEVIRGSISDLITSTGTLEALETVEVGTQVSGIINKIYVDYNSEVKKGQVLARIDETPLLAQLVQSQASVESAEAEADYQEANFERYKALSDKDLIAELDYRQVEYNYRKAKAALKNAQSVHERNKINLAYATITSPIDGIILDRAVDEGQTVAASFNTPTLFTIANDLTEMQVEASVDEADIGRVKVGQRVEFTVDAYPEMNFTGEVTQIRLQPVVSSNVVTYTVIINAPNDELKLMPGMTANISFYVMEKKDIVLMPAEALNFMPDPMSLHAYQELHPEVEIKMPIGPGKYIWVKRENSIEPVKAELGDTDELYYEVLSGLQAGDQVVTGISSVQQGMPEMTMSGMNPSGTNASGTNASGTNSSGDRETRSPFMPQPPGQRGNPPRSN